MQSNDLRRAGLKATLPRLRILAILEDHRDRHLSAEDVYRALRAAGEETGLATVYRVLTQLRTAGLVERHHFADGHAVFEIDSGRHHDHIVCVQCGEVVEFMDEAIEKRQQAVAQKLGFAIEDHSLVLHGDCRRKGCPNRQPR